MEDTIAIRVKIYGRVQGVGYRAWTEREATALGLLGWVRNCADGSVEALFQGSAQKVRELIARCEEGPRFSEVERVEQSDDDSSQSLSEFLILPTLK